MKKKILLLIMGLAQITFAKENNRIPASQVTCNIKAQRIATFIAKENGLLAEKSSSSWSSDNHFVVTIDEKFKVFIFTSNSENSCSIETIVVGH